MQLLGTGVASVVKDFSGVFNALPMLAVALIGFALAAISYKNGQMIPNAPAPKKDDASNDADEGEIEDDEI